MLALLQILIVSLYVFSICNIDVFAYSAINLIGTPLIMAFVITVWRKLYIDKFSIFQPQYLSIAHINWRIFSRT